MLEAYRKQYNSLPLGYISYKRIGKKKYPPSIESVIGLLVTI